MAGVYKRAGDKARGKSGKWTAWWLDERGKQRSRAGFTDKARTLELAQRLEGECRAIREGMVDPAEVALKEAARRPLADHVAAYRDHLVARGGGRKHADHAAGAVRRLLEGAGVGSVATLTVDRIQAALAAMADPAGPHLSARTCNHALGALKAFARWLEESARVDRVPRGLASLARFNEEADVRYSRRALGEAEVGRLLDAAEAGGPILLSRRGYQYEERWMTGPDRAMLYRLAMATGFRAGELRSLTPEAFRLDAAEPAIVISAEAAKNGRKVVQPVSREMAEKLAPLLAGKAAGEPVLSFPEKTARLLRHDLARAGIPYRDAAGNVVDFHALRVSYITNLIRSGVNPKVVQILARHSSITLTMDVYAKLDDQDVRKALEGK